MFQSLFSSLRALNRLKLNLQVVGTIQFPLYRRFRKIGVISLYPGITYLVLNVSCEYLSLYLTIVSPTYQYQVSVDRILSFFHLKLTKLKEQVSQKRSYLLDPRSCLTCYTQFHLVFLQWLVNFTLVTNINIALPFQPRSKLVQTVI